MCSCVLHSYMFCCISSTHIPKSRQGYNFGRLLAREILFTFIQVFPSAILFFVYLLFWGGIWRIPHRTGFHLVKDSAVLLTRRNSIVTSLIACFLVVCMLCANRFYSRVTRHRNTMRYRIVWVVHWNLPSLPPPPPMALALALALALARSAACHRRVSVSPHRPRPAASTASPHHQHILRRHHRHRRRLLLLLLLLSVVCWPCKYARRPPRRD